MVSRKIGLTIAMSMAMAIFLSRHLSAWEEKATAVVPPPRAEASTQPPSILGGSASCAGRGCHGGATAEPKPGIQQNEYSTWLAHDKHARAFQVLHEERGQRIGKNLGIVAHEDARCLACHVNPILASAETPKDLQVLRGEGVSCEACHGSAGGSDGWLAAHTTGAWKKSPDQKGEYAKHHMTLIADLEVQAQTCAGCHVGAPADSQLGIPARDLNHDLMAAGHPRLNFELTVFRINQPPHWRTDKTKDDATYEARSWAVGQAVSARASLVLLAHRADEAGKDKAPWPEFAETDCFTCHADLREKSWRRSQAYYQGRTPGALPYSRWFSAMLPVLEPVQSTAELTKEFQEIAKKMGVASPAAKQIAEAARKALPVADGLIAKIKAAKLDPARIKDMGTKLKEFKGKTADMRWEEIEQMALAAAVLQVEKGPLTGSNPTEKALADLFRALSFPSGYESPQTFRRGDALSQALEAVLALP